MADRLYLLVDCHALLYRGHFAMMRNPLRASDGTNTSGLFFLVRELLDRRDAVNPDVMVAVFDHPSPSFRVRMYPEYKANRPPMPGELVIQSDTARKLIPILGIPAVEKEGFEADDIIAWFCQEARQSGDRVEILSSDKDLLQLVSANVSVIRPGGGNRPDVVVGPGDVEPIMGVTAGQVADFLALTGDSSDNVPGAKGIGKKTAQKLLRKFGDLEGIYGSLDSIGGSAGKKLEEDRDMVDLSRRLVSLWPPREMDIHLGDLSMKQPSNDEAADILSRMGMNSIQERLGIESSETDLFGVLNSEHENRCSTRIARSAGDITEYGNQDSPGGMLAVDTETTSRDPLQAEPVGIAIAESVDDVLYVPLAGDGALEMRDAVPLLRDKLKGRQIVAQNGKYDIHVLEHMGIILPELAGDPMIADYLLRPEIRSHSLSNLSVTWLKRKMQSYDQVLGNAETLEQVAAEKVAEYCGADASTALELSRLLRKRLEDDSQLLRIYDEVELPLVRVLADMERRGVGLDTGSLDELETEFSGYISELEERAAGILGHSINLNSPAQVSHALFEELGLDTVRKTSTGADSSSMEVLEKLRGDHKLVETVIEHREISKLLNTYVQRLPEYVSPRDGLIHTSFSQTVTATGRLSSSGPNLQNIPIRTERGRMVRKCFVPGGEGQVFVTADYSQIELRVLAHLAGPGRMREAYRENIDIHGNTSVAVFGDSTPENRRKAKEVNFSILYGISPWGLSNRINISRSEASSIIEKYVETYPEVKSFFDQCVDYAQEHGETRTILGRKREFPGMKNAKGASRSSMERMAVNTTVQGSAADIIKLAMLRVSRRLKSLPDAGMVLQVHDELVVTVGEENAEMVATILREEMENAFQLKVPLVVDTGIGRDWLQAQH